MSSRPSSQPVEPTRSDRNGDFSLESLKETLATFQDVLDGAEQSKGSYDIDEIELGLELTVKETFTLVAEARTHASIKVKRKPFGPTYPIEPYQIKIAILQPQERHFS